MFVQKAICTKQMCTEGAGESLDLVEPQGPWFTPGTLAPGCVTKPICFSPQPACSGSGSRNALQASSGSAQISAELNLQTMLLNRTFE